MLHCSRFLTLAVAVFTDFTAVWEGHQSSGVSKGSKGKDCVGFPYP